MFEITVMIGIVVGLSQIGKTIGLQTKYVPLLNLTLGIMLGVLFMGGDIKTNFDHTKVMKKDVDAK
ncbi:holin [Bacillus thuringiensis]|uniref:holin n=1 Tax=Bacillus thuringiensis TaxID=1428 RepID=UPI00136B5827|nr:holin [Bacillus thuringiensis]MYW23884.1 holin [Bacillus thuringiensis]